MCDEVTAIYAVKIPESQKRSGRKQEHTAGLRLLKYGLRDMFGIGPGEVLTERGPSGKPYLVNCPGVHFNISHSGGYAVCAVGSVPMGVDIEFRRELDSRRLAEKALTAEEKKDMENSCDPGRYFFDRWVEKESYLKWKGTGITENLKKIDRKDGFCCHFELADGFSCAIWSEKPMKLKICRIDDRELFEDDRMQ